MVKKKRKGKWEILWARVDNPSHWHHFYKRQIFNSKSAALRFAREERFESSGSILTKVVRLRRR